MLTETQAMRLWELFVGEVWKDAHIKPPLENFLGSVKIHKKAFKRALVTFNAEMSVPDETVEPPEFPLVRES